MARLLDRHGEDGRISNAQLYVAGKIKMGAKIQGAGFENWPYFKVEPFTEIAEERGMLLSHVVRVLDHFSPGQDLAKPTVLTVTFLSDVEEHFASAAYQLKGNHNMLRCTGDGQTLQYKVGAGDVIQVSNGHAVKAFQEAGQSFAKGAIIRCPGSSDEGRYPWCEKCRAELKIQFAIRGAEPAGLWLFTTTDRRFYSQFWTQVEIAQGWVQQGLIKSLIGVPFVLRRTPPIDRNVPLKKEGDTRLIRRAMPGLAFQIHPVFMAEVMNRQRHSTRLFDGPGEEVKQLMASANDEMPEWDEIKHTVREGFVDGQYRCNWSELRQAILLHLRTSYFQFDDDDQVKAMLAAVSDGEPRKAPEYWTLARDYVLSHAQSAIPASEGSEGEYAMDTDIEGEVTVLPDDEPVPESIETPEPPPEPELDQSITTDQVPF